MENDKNKHRNLTVESCGCKGCEESKIDFEKDNRRNVDESENGTIKTNDGSKRRSSRQKSASKIYERGELDKSDAFQHTVKNNKPRNVEIAVCNSCGHKQDAKLGFPCKKCGCTTFTRKEEDELRESSNSKSKFVPLK